MAKDEKTFVRACELLPCNHPAVASIKSPTSGETRFVCYGHYMHIHNTLARRRLQAAGLGQQPDEGRVEYGKRMRETALQMIRDMAKGSGRVGNFRTLGKAQLTEG